MILRALYRTILYGNILIAFAALGLYEMNFLKLGHPLQFGPMAWMVFLGTIATYNAARLFPIWIKGRALPYERYRWWLHYRWPLAVISAILLLVCAWLALQVPVRILAWLSLPAFLALVYNIPFFLNRGLPSLREIGMLKTFLIALVWAGVTAGLPAAWTGHEPLDKDVWLLVAEMFLLILAVTLPFDLRDVEEDQQFGIRTLPQYLGFSGTRWLSLGVLALSLGLGLVRDPDPLALTVSYLPPALALWMTRPWRGDGFYLGWLDGSLILMVVIYWGAISIY